MITGYYQQFLRRTLYIYTKKLYSAVGLLSGVSVRFLRDDALCPAGLHLSTRGGHQKLSRYGSIEFDPSHIASGHPVRQNTSVNRALQTHNDKSHAWSAHGKCYTINNLTFCSAFFSRPRSDGWPHRGCRPTFSIYLCPLSLWLTLPRGALSMSWFCPSRPCVVFLSCVHLALFLVLSLSPGNSLISSWYDHSMLASLPWRYLTVRSVLYSFVNTQGEATSQNLWSLYDRHVVGITWHDAWS